MGERGRRIPDGEWFAEDRQPGDYGKMVVEGESRWFNWPPGAPYAGVLKSFDPDRPEELFHEVEEHDDGTITVRASILMRGQVQEAHAPGGPIVDGYSGWHGFLERGVWRDA